MSPAASDAPESGPPDVAPAPVPPHAAPAQPRRRFRLLALAAWLAVAGIYGGVAFALLFPHELRNTAPTHVRLAWAAFMFRTFLFHEGCVLAAIAGFAILARRRRLLLAALPLALAALLPAAWSYVPRSAPAVRGERVRVMLFNLLERNRAAAAALAEIRAVDPDLLVLLEYGPRWQAALHSELFRTYPYFHAVPESFCFGLAVYSKRPFVGPVVDDLPLGRSGTPQFRAVTRIDGHEVALYALHLVPPQRRRGVTEQRLMMADLLDALAREELPFLLCGDFNFTADSVYADALRAINVRDVHDLAGRGRGSTWPVLGPLRYVPGLRLDHIYLSHELTATTARTGIGEGSDHRPVIAEIGFKP